MKVPMPDPLASLPQFIQTVVARLNKGRGAYGDRSFSKRPDDLVSEIQEELVDVCAWSFILWQRLENVSRRLEASETPSPVRASMPPEVVAQLHRVFGSDGRFPIRITLPAVDVAPELPEGTRERP